MGAYEQNSIYKQGLSEKEIKELVSGSNNYYRFNVLDKYKDNNWNWQDFESHLMVSYNNVLNMLVVSTSINIYTSFNAIYDAADDCGTNDWPALAYAEIDELGIVQNELDWITLAFDSVQTTKNMGVVFTILPGSKKLAYCVNKNISIPTGWLNTPALSVLV